jgi:integrase
MARATQEDQLLASSRKAIQKAVRGCIGGKLREFRIEGVRGLVLHVLPSGTATWYLHYDVEIGKKRRRRKFKLGRVDEVGLAQATAEVERVRPLIREGEDPASDKIDTRNATMCAELAEERLEKGDPLRPGTLRDYRHVLQKDILPVIGTTPAKAVTRENIIDVLDRISARGSNRRADTASAVISSIFGYGVDRGLVPTNPATGLRNRHDYQPRDVVASDDDIRRLWSAIDRGEAAMSSAVGTIVKLALLTGVRRSENAGVREVELDLSAAEPVLTIHSGRAKNRNAHRVPLSRQAAELFRDAIAKAGTSEFVFPSERTATHIAPESVSQAMERTRAKLGIEDVAMHDLRRTVGTYMSRLGVPKDIRERILNHGGKRKGSITEGVYNRYEYNPEKRAALEL